MKQKVGLAVCYDSKNFGSQLQVFATVKEIENLGYKPEIIKYKKVFTPIFIMQTIPRLFNPYFMRSKFGKSNKNEFLKNNLEIEKNIKIRNQRFIDFMNKYFEPISKEYVGWEKLVRESNKNYSIFLCGSDQLWLPHNLGSHFYTLEFARKEKIKIAYSTSFGVSQIPWFQKLTTKKYLNRIQFLSIREQKGKEIIKSLTGREAKVVCDPTLLLSKEEWNNIIQNRKIINEKYIFCYLLGTNEYHRKICIEFAKKNNLKIVTIPFLNNYNEFDINFGDIQLFDIDCFDFVNLIRNAEYVLTDSFHGTVFSIINEKQFMTFNRFSNTDKNSRNSRIDNLCNILSLEERRYSDNIDKILNKIDYNKVNKKLNEFRKKSSDFLEKSLKKSMELNDD